MKKEKSKLPNKITCCNCKKSKAVRAEILQNRIKVYGSLEKLLTDYECRGCRQKPDSKAPTAKRSRKPKEGEVLNEQGEIIYFWQSTDWKGFSTPPAAYPKETQSDYIRIFGTACARPDIFLNNNRFCDGCPYLVTCACPRKRTKADGGHTIDTETGETKKLTYYMRRKLGLVGKKRNKTILTDPIPVIATGKPQKKMTYYMRRKLGLLKK